MFLDYRKAFDLVDRTYLWQKLLKTNINGKLLNVLQNMYNNAKSCVRVGNSTSTYFPCNVGVRQGDNVSPLLFALFLNDFKDFISTKYFGLPFIEENIVDSLNTNDMEIYCISNCFVYCMQMIQL